MGDNKATLRPVTWDGIKAWLPIIVMIASLLIGLGLFQGQITMTEKQVAFNTRRLEVLQELVQGQQVRLARIENDIGYIRMTLERLEKEGN